MEALKQLALLGALDDHVELASAEFATLLDLSQQTASRRLIELTEMGLVHREMGIRKQRIRITEEGRGLLQAEHLLYARLFEQRDRIALSGAVKTGLGEGRYYLSRPGYKTQFNKALGWEPYPGTLNLELSGPEANKLRFLRKNPVYTIEAFQAEGRTFGGVTCHPAHVTLLPATKDAERSGKGEQVECAAILPHRSHYTTTIELIAPVRLRDALPCNDGTRLEVIIDLHTKAEAAATAAGKVTA